MMIIEYSREMIIISDINDIIYFSDHDLEVWHEYNIKGNILVVDGVEYWIKQGTKDGFKVIKKLKK